MEKKNCGPSTNTTLVRLADTLIYIFFFILFVVRGGRGISDILSNLSGKLISLSDTIVYENIHMDSFIIQN